MHTWFSLTVHIWCGPTGENSCLNSVSLRRQWCVFCLCVCLSICLSVSVSVVVSVWGMVVCMCVLDVLCGGVDCEVCCGVWNGGVEWRVAWRVVCEMESVWWCGPWRVVWCVHGVWDVCTVCVWWWYPCSRKTEVSITFISNAHAPQIFCHCCHGMLVFSEVFVIHTTKKCEGSFGQETSHLQLALVGPFWALVGPVPGSRFCTTTNETPPHEELGDVSRSTWVDTLIQCLEGVFLLLVEGLPKRLVVLQLCWYTSFGFQRWVSDTNN